MTEENEEDIRKAIKLEGRSSPVYTLLSCTQIIMKRTSSDLQATAIETQIHFVLLWSLT